MTLLFCFCILLMFLRCTLALLNCPWVYFGIVKLPFVFLSVMLSLVILVYYVVSWWSGTVG